eukprot:scaffold4554_cov178-Amphora_coffeaeformis.AAC.12
MMVATKATHRTDSSATTTTTTSEQSSSAIKSAARGTLVTILLRLVSFLCTQWTFRRLDGDPTVLGQTSIQLELVLTTVLFISREGFRLALTRNISDENWNVAWLSIPVVTTVAAVALAWHAVVATTTAATTPDYWYGGMLYCLASAIEGWGEPAVLYSLRQMDVALKASAEGAATVTKTIATVALLQALPEQPITAFGLSQVLYACTYTGLLYVRTARHLPAPVLSWSSSWHSPTCRLTLVFTVQGLFKHFLTEGDRFVLSALTSGYQQGVYAMGAAYGGLAARLLLQPLEENARLLWSRLAAGQSLKSQQQQEQQHRLLEDSYTVLVKAVFYLGLLFSCIAVHYTGIMLHILAGRKWGSNPEAAAVLSAFCVYTAFLACNGMTEAFVYAVASTAADMGRMGAVHTAIGLIFAGTAAWAVQTYGTVGLVAANCLAMALRTMYSVQYAARYFHQSNQDDTLDKSHSTLGVVLERLLGRMSPHAAVLLAFGSSWAATRTSFYYFEQQNAVPGSLGWWRGAATHVGVGVACAVGTLLLAFILESSFRRTAVALYKGSKRD